MSITPIVETILAAALLVILATVALVAFAVARRRSREEYFRAVDDLRRTCTPIINGLLKGTIAYSVGLQALKAACESKGINALEQFIVARNTPTESEVETLRRLCEDLDFVGLWQHRLAAVEQPSFNAPFKAPGRVMESIAALSFVQRAESAHNLGIIRHRPSWPLLVRALDDPHIDVRSVSARSLALLAEPGGFTALADRLKEIVESSSASLSVRHIKAVLTSFPLERSIDLVGSLKHPHPRVRYLATDIIRGMVEHYLAESQQLVLPAEDFSPAVAQIFLTELATDDNPDVRARAAPVICRLDDARAIPALEKLLDDPEWFVRLHATRAVADRRCEALMERVSQALTDSHWRVREAAARALLAFGEAGVNRLLDHFLTTQDLYSREQIAEVLESAGLILSLLGFCNTEGHERETRAVERLAKMGKISAMLAAAEVELDAVQRAGIASQLSECTEPQTKALVEESEQRAPGRAGALAGVGSPGGTLQE